MVDITITEVNADDFEVIAEVDGETKRYVFGLSQWGGNTVLRDTIANIEFRDTSEDFVAPSTSTPTAQIVSVFAIPEHPVKNPNNKPQTNKSSEVL